MKREEVGAVATVRARKKLIEVALPLDAINKASAREKSIRHGHPSTLHLWWARRPLAAARAVIFAQMVDDPSEYVDVLLSDPKIRRASKRRLRQRQAEFESRSAAAAGEAEGDSAPTLADAAAELERDRLFRLIEELVQWKNTTNEEVLERARTEIWQSWRRACAENAGHPRAKELFDRHKLPAFHDPFAGGGTLPLEAQRLGLEAHASDLNPVPFSYLWSQGREGCLGSRLMAVVADGDRGRIYLPAIPEYESVARQAAPEWKPNVGISHWPGRTNVVKYGLTTFGDLFTPRQLVALTTFSDLVGEATERVRRDAAVAGLTDESRSLRAGGAGAQAYAEAVGVYLAFALSKLADRGSTICTWFTERDSTRNTFARQSIPMTWDFAELNTLLTGTGSFLGAVEWTRESVDCVAVGERSTASGVVLQTDAGNQSLSLDRVVSTDPPYYDNIGYADLSDFFYVWLRRSLKAVFPALFTTLAAPKAEELVATPYRHGGRKAAETFFLNGMALALRQLAEKAHPGFPVTVYYAFKQSETQRDSGTASTGWETFLDAVIRSGFTISGTWPMRTELGNRMVGMGTNALASSVVLVCHRRPDEAPVGTRREFLTALRSELPQALPRLPSALAWRLSRASPRCSTPLASPSRCATPWGSSTRRSTRCWQSRRATSMPTAAGRSCGSRSTASRRVPTARPKRCRRRRTRASTACSGPASLRRALAGSGC